jgi:nucleotide-binding universal stress UspA family protein
MDGSEHSRWALQWAMNEAVARRVLLTVLSVHRPESVPHPEGDLDQERAARKVQALVDKAASNMSGPVPPITLRVIPGSPAAQLIAAGRYADLLVVGSRGTGGFGQLGPGSVSSQVAYDSSCPVVIIFRPWTAP